MAKQAEELGFNAVTTHDHIILDHSQKYHNSCGFAESVDVREKMGLSVTDFFETMSVLSYVAGITERVRMIPCALVLPWRNPVLLAKQAITLDNLSGGRFVCLVCIGNMPKDFEAMQVNYKDKGRILNEYLEVLKQFFSKGRCNFRGKFINIPDVEFDPKPIKLPLWYAGSFKSFALERVAKYADGFFPSGSPTAFERGLVDLREALRKYRRKESEIEVGTQFFFCLQKNSRMAQKMIRNTIESFYHGAKAMEKKVEAAFRNGLIGSPEDIIDKIQAYLDVGVQTFDLRVNALGLDDALNMMKLFAREVAPSFK
jgi:alkanesulfonate monooxygenase SsuD/methylene tetrahydromethanopterin reductase-like flavin-dependent oxidoreductase (luciferase family)